MPSQYRYSTKYRRFYNDQYYYKDHEYKPSRRNKFRINTTDPLVYINRRIKMARYMNDKAIICKSGWTQGQGWGGLYRAWQAFIIERQKGDKDTMTQYAQVIRKIQKDINVQLTDFPELKLVALEYVNDPENKDLLEEVAQEQEKEVDDLTSEDVLKTMMEQDRLAYELANMQY